MCIICIFTNNFQASVPQCDDPISSFSELVIDNSSTKHCIEPVNVPDRWPMTHFNRDRKSNIKKDFEVRKYFEDKAKDARLVPLTAPWPPAGCLCSAICNCMQCWSSLCGSVCQDITQRFHLYFRNYRFRQMSS